MPADIVLLGAGHAHVEVLRRAALRPTPGLRLTLVTREAFSPYSGMLPGLIRGDYSFAQAHIDCARLAAAAGARLVVAAAEAIDLAAGRVLPADGVALPFDLLSINVGGAPAVPAGGIGVKPISRFLARLAALAAALPGDAAIAVVGGGAGGCELALALAHRWRHARIVLVSRSALLPTAPARVRRIALAALARNAVTLRHGVAVGHADGTLLLASGESMPAVAALWATGVRGPAFLAESGLACDAAGCVRVAPTLRSLTSDRVFAAGDCAAFTDRPLPKSGVWAVRAASPLLENLRRAAAGQTLLPWQPQRDALHILGLGDGRAVAWRRGVALEGRLAWHLKDTIDRRWMARFQLLAPVDRHAAAIAETNPCATASPPSPPTASDRK